jgi:hypothetical protein
MKVKYLKKIMTSHCWYMVKTMRCFSTIFTLWLLLKHYLIAK